MKEGINKPFLVIIRIIKTVLRLKLSTPGTSVPTRRKVVTRRTPTASGPREPLTALSVLPQVRLEDV